MFSIDLQSGIPIYKQLEKNITELIADGSLKTDEKLPSIRELANNLCINPNTAVRVYVALEQKKLIYTVPSRGFFVKSEETAVKILQEQTTEKFREAAKEAIKCGVTEQELRDIIDAAAKNAVNFKKGGW